MRVLDYDLPSLKMGVWREIQRLKTARMQHRDEVSAQLKKLDGVEDETAFELFAARMELNLAEQIAQERQQMADIIVRAFGSKFSADDLTEKLGADAVPVVFKALDIMVMNQLTKKGDEMPPAKGKPATNFDTMNEYQQVIHLYGLLHREWHWSRDEIDNEELEYVFDLFIAQAKGNEEPLVPIDQIL